MDMLIYDAIVDNTTLHDENDMEEIPDSTITGKIHGETEVSITDDVKKYSEIYATSKNKTLLINHDNLSKGDIPITWLLLDSQSTIDIIMNKDILTNIHKVDHKLTI